MHCRPDRRAVEWPHRPKSRHVYGVPSEPFTQILKTDVARMAEVIRNAGMKPN